MEIPMRTIVFYSYKGGTGRTLALANIAVCLARMKKNVALLDLDFDAPGLQFKFGDDVEVVAATAPGALEYFYQNNKDTDALAPSKITPAPIRADTILEMPPKESGAIHLMHAGDLHSDKYWEALRSRDWYQLFSLSEDSEEDKARVDRNRTFLLAFKDSVVAALDPRPDYFLIDCRTGICEMEAIAISYWADMVVSFFNASSETTHSIPHLINRISGSRSAEDKPLEFLTVLSRIPSALDDPREDAIKKHLKDLMFPGNKSAQVLTVHTDRAIETEEILRIRPTGKTGNTRIAHEYLDIVKYLVCGVGASTDQLKVARDTAAIAIKLDESDQVFDRVFELSLANGLMLNTHDAQPNVSFKVETLIRMLNELHRLGEDVVYERGVDKENAKKRVDRMFREAGASCGHNFGGALLHRWHHDKTLPIGDAAKAQKWCEFDSAVGFGRFDYVVHSNIDKVNALPEGRIKTALVGGQDVLQVKNNFLVGGQSVTDPRLCQFLEGYTAGVLRRILEEPDLEVEHPTECCQQYAAKNEAGTCDFFITRKER
jgi:cellulose biosynthesis protein BcsQ/predicted hydrocarbon binding protein